MNELFESFAKVRKSATVLSSSTDDMRQLCLLSIAKAIYRNKSTILKENAKDLEEARKNNISEAILHRLELSESKLTSALDGLVQLSKLEDPVGKVLEKREIDSFFILEKKTFPLGVIGMIFEARPDALIQIAGLALRSGNGIVLKGGKEAQNTNRTLVKTIQDATKDAPFGENWIMAIESHEDVDTLLKAEGYVDLLIPRGSNAFVRHVMDNTRIPVMGHADGICTTYIDEKVDFDSAIRICIDAKTQYPAACNATETFLIHRRIAELFLPDLNKAFQKSGVKVHADETAFKYMPGSIKATEDDFHTEFLDKECAVKVVSSVKEAVEHIQSHGSHHTDAILTEIEQNARFFTSNVDSADVFVNCSTRFADGFRFGLGAEVGISTSKLHARGPVGLDGLMTTKWILTGNGQIVSDYATGKKSFNFKELEK